MNKFSNTLNIGLLWAVLLSCWMNGTAQSPELHSMYEQQFGSLDQNVIKHGYLQITDEELLKIFDNQPSFGMFHDNYFTTGVPTNQQVNAETSDAKYQISIRQRITKSILPFRSTLFLTYTQKSFWDIYQNSSPFSENNYNPGITLMRPKIINHQLRGIATLSVEHESNGLDSINSRSWNYIAVSWIYFYNPNIWAQIKIWRGWLAEDNDDLYDYRGYGLAALNYKSKNERFWATLLINPRASFGAANTTMELNYKLTKKSNQYLFAQWYNGYGENLVDYNKYTSMVRVGICIKPSLRNFY